MLPCCEHGCEQCVSSHVLLNVQLLLLLLLTTATPTASTRPGYFNQEQAFPFLLLSIFLSFSYLPYYPFLLLLPFSFFLSFPSLPFPPPSLLFPPFSIAGLWVLLSELNTCAKPCQYRRVRGVLCIANTYWILSGTETINSGTGRVSHAMHSLDCREHEQVQEHDVVHLVLLRQFINQQLDMWGKSTISVRCDTWVQVIFLLSCQPWSSYTVIRKTITAHLHCVSLFLTTTQLGKRPQLLVYSAHIGCSVVVYTSNQMSAIPRSRLLVSSSMFA